MRICLITGIFPPDIGGPATYVSRLSEALQHQGHVVEVVTLGATLSDDPPYVTRVSRAYPLPFRLLVLFFTLIQHGRHCDIWYINGLEVPAVLAGRLLHKRLIMKIVGDYAWERAMNIGLTSDLIDDFQQKPQMWKVELHKKLRSWYVRQVEQVITPSRYLKHLVLRSLANNQKFHRGVKASERLNDLPDPFPGNQSGHRNQQKFIFRTSQMLSCPRFGG